MHLLYSILSNSLLTFSFLNECLGVVFSYGLCQWLTRIPGDICILLLPWIWATLLIDYSPTPWGVFALEGWRDIGGESLHEILLMWGHGCYLLLPFSWADWVTVRVIWVPQALKVRPIGLLWVHDILARLIFHCSSRCMSQHCGDDASSLAKWFDRDKWGVTDAGNNVGFSCCFWEPWNG